LGLTKPAGSDLVDISVLNTNSDKIDAAIGAKVVTSGTRPSTPFDGQIIYQTDTQTTHIYKSATSSWEDVAAGAKIVTSSTRPSAPYTGQLIHETDTHKTYVYSSGWVLVADATIDVSNVVRSGTTRTIFYQSTDPTTGMVTGDIRVWA
jgi:hypothetical protein